VAGSILAAVLALSAWAAPPAPYSKEYTITIDATALNPPTWWQVPGVTPMIMTLDPDSTDAFRTTAPRDLRLKPGTYRFGTFTFDFPFAVTLEGTLDYAKGLDQCVSGRGTNVLPVQPHPALRREPGILRAGTRFGEERCTMADQVEDLLEALDDVDDATREEAAKALAALADPSTLESLLRACEDEFWSVRAHAAWGVAKIGGPKAIEALIALFNDPIMEVRNEAVDAMAHLGRPAADRLIACLKDERWRVREHAAKACGLIKEARAVDGLIVACRDRDGAVKSAAAEALGRIADAKAVPALIKLFKDSSKTVRETAGTALVAIGTPSVDPLIQSLKDPDFVVRCHAARALGGMTTDYQIGRTWVTDQKVVDALIGALKDADRAVREDATIALGMIGDKRAIDPLIEAMKDGAVKRHAIMSLGMIGDASALPAVLDALKGKGIRQEGTPTPGCIVSEEAFVKEAAATALGHFRDPRVIPDLVMLLKDGILREKAAASLVLIGDAAIEPLVAFLHDPKASEIEGNERALSFATSRLTAAEALKKLTLETLRKLGWEPPPEEEESVEASKADNLRVDKPLGDTGRFGPSGDLARPTK
jgi:HEAT repeat protein